MDPYEEWKRRMLELGYPEREIDDVLAQMRLEDESKKHNSESRQKAAQRTVEDD